MGDVRNFLILLKASLKLYIYSNFSIFLRVVNKRKALSPALERKQEREVRRLVSYFTFFTLVRLLISMNDWYLFGLASIPPR